MIIKPMATALYSKLAGLSAVTTQLANGTASIHHMLAPKNDEYPFLVYSLQFGGPENITPSDSHEQLWFIRTYDRNQTTAASIAQSIGTALQNGTITVGSYQSVIMELDEELEGFEIDSSGNGVFMAGGFYRFLLDV